MLFGVLLLLSLLLLLLLVLLVLLHYLSLPGGEKWVWGRVDPV